MAQLTLLPLLALAMLLPMSAVAGEVDNVKSAPYRLTLERSSVFRLADQTAGTPGAGPKIIMPAQLARLPFAEPIYRASLAASLDPALVHAVIAVESNHNSAARSSKGAIGLMQLMPDTALRYGVADPARSVELNLKAGTRYLKDLMQQFDGRLDLVLAAYNAGENTVVRYGERIPPYPETQAYVPSVLSRYREWQTVAPKKPGRVEYMPGTQIDPGPSDRIR